MYFTSFHFIFEGSHVLMSFSFVRTIFTCVCVQAPWVQQYLEMFFLKRPPTPGFFLACFLVELPVVCWFDVLELLLFVLFKSLRSSYNVCKVSSCMLSDCVLVHAAAWFGGMFSWSDICNVWSMSRSCVSRCDSYCWRSLEILVVIMLAWW